MIIFLLLFKLYLYIYMYIYIYIYNNKGLQNTRKPLTAKAHMLTHTHTHSHTPYANNQQYTQ